MQVPYNHSGLDSEVLISLVIYLDVAYIVLDIYSRHQIYIIMNMLSPSCRLGNDVI